MYCPKCGLAQAEGSLYCAACGQKLAPIDEGSASKARSPKKNYRAIIAVGLAAVVALVLIAVIAGTVFNQEKKDELPQLFEQPFSELFAAEPLTAAEMLEQAFKNEGIDNNTKEFTRKDANVQALEGYNDYFDVLRLYDGDRQSLSLSLLKSGATVEYAEATTFYCTEAAPLDSLKKFAAQEGFNEEALTYYEDNHKTVFALAEDRGLVLWVSAADLSQGVQRMAYKVARSGSVFSQELRAEWEEGAEGANTSGKELDQKQKQEGSGEGKAQADRDERVVENAQNTANMNLYSVVKGDPKAAASMLEGRVEVFDDYGTAYYAIGSQEDALSLLRLEYEAIEAPLTVSLVNAANNENIMGLTADEIRQGNANSVTVRLAQVPNDDNPLVFARSIIEAYGFSSDEAVIVDYSGTLMTSCNKDGVVLFTSAVPMRAGLYDVSVIALAPESANLDAYRSNFRMAFNDGIQLQ